MKDCKVLIEPTAESKDKETNMKKDMKVVHEKGLRKEIMRLKCWQERDGQKK